MSNTIRKSLNFSAIILGTLLLMQTTCTKSNLSSLEEPEGNKKMSADHTGDRPLKSIVSVEKTQLTEDQSICYLTVEIKNELEHASINLENLKITWQISGTDSINGSLDLKGELGAGKLIEEKLRLGEILKKNIKTYQVQIHAKDSSAAKEILTSWKTSAEQEAKDRDKEKTKIKTKRKSIFINSVIFRRGAKSISALQQTEKERLKAINNDHKRSIFLIDSYPESQDGLCMVGILGVLNQNKEKLKLN